jgi:hypothetical protein
LNFHSPEKVEHDRGDFLGELARCVVLTRASG